MHNIYSPFGGAARHIRSLSTEYVNEMYIQKCGQDIARHFHGHNEIHLYECTTTGYRFWRPEEVAGGEKFYRELATAWPNYYRTSRWEYDLARPYIKPDARVLEIGCGRGFFLKSLEGHVNDAMGLEFNMEAVTQKVTAFDIHTKSIEALTSDRSQEFDVICTFQVLEHIVEPASFLEACLGCLKPDGLLIISTPNYDYLPLKEQTDAFDLPPHHMGHFTTEVYKRIADLYRLTIELIEVEPRHVEFEAVHGPTNRDPSYKLARRIAAIMFRRAYKKTSEPGRNITVVFKQATMP